MKISELQKKYPNKEFYCLQAEPSYKHPKLEKLEDMMLLTNKIGYIETELSADEASYANYKYIVNDFERTLSYKILREFDEYLNNEYEKKSKLEKMCKCEGFTQITLYGLDTYVMYCESSMGLDSIDVDKVYEGLSEALENFYEKKEKIEKEKDEEIHRLILAGKDKYLISTTAKDKEDVVRDVQMKLRLKLGLDGRTDSRASKLYIKNIYEGTDEDF